MDPLEDMLSKTHSMSSIIPLFLNILNGGPFLVIKIKHGFESSGKNEAKMGLWGY